MYINPLVSSAVCADYGELIAAAASAASSMPDRSLSPPGPKTYVGNSFIDLRVALTILVERYKIHLCIGSNEGKNKLTEKQRWLLFYYQVFGGTEDANGNRLLGPMNQYKMYNNQDPEKKVKTFFYAGLSFDANECRKAHNNSVTPTPLQFRSFKLSNERLAAKNAIDSMNAERAAATANRRALNEGQERAMGLRNDERGINLPPGVANREGMAEAAQHLGRPPSFRPSNRTQDERRTRSELEAALAESAAAGCETTSFGPGEKKKAPRNGDVQDLMDDFAKNMSGDAVVISNAMKSVGEAFTKSTAPPPETPTKKKRRQNMEIQGQMKLLLDEKKALKDMDEPTDDVDRQIQQLRAERNAINTNKPMTIKTEKVTKAVSTEKDPACIDLSAEYDSGVPSKKSASKAIDLYLCDYEERMLQHEDFEDEHATKILGGFGNAMTSGYNLSAEFDSAEKPAKKFD